MEPATPLSTHEKFKKELLVLGFEPLLLISLLMLNDNSLDDKQLLAQLKDAYKLTPEIGKWTKATLKRHLTKLTAQKIVFLHWGDTYELAEKWQNTAVFTADSLGLKCLDTVIEVSRKHQGFPAGAKLHRRSWYVESTSLAQRCIHMILKGDARNFALLYQQLREEGNAFVRYQAQASIERVQDVLSTLDWSFWKKRPVALQWEGFTHATVTLLHEEDVSYADLEAMAAHLLKQKEAAQYTYLMAQMVMPGMHYFSDKGSLFASTPGVVMLLHLANGDEAAALTAAGRIPEPDDDTIIGVHHIIGILLQYRGGQFDEMEMVKKVSSSFVRTSVLGCMRALSVFCLMRLGRDVEGEQELQDSVKIERLSPLDWLLLISTASWEGVKLSLTQLHPVIEMLSKGTLKKFPWLEKEIMLALRAIHPGLEVVKALSDQEATGAISGLFPARPMWEYALRLLRQPVTKQKVLAEKEYRTIWIVDFDQEKVYSKEQKKGKRGWSKGRKMKWQELVHPQEHNALEEADYRIVEALSSYDGRRFSPSVSFSEDMINVDFGHVLHILADHPRVYMGENQRIPIELFRREPELQVQETEAGLLLRFNPPVEHAGYAYYKETPTRYGIYHLTEDQARMAFAVGTGVEVPDEQRAVVEEITDDLRSAVTIQSSLDLVDQDLEKIAGSPQPCFHLLPYEDGYKIELYVKPLPQDSFYFKPGDGLARSIVELEEGRRLLERPLSLEEAEAQQAIAACPTLAATPGHAYEWVIEDTQTALRILLELRKLVGEQLVSIEHPKGEKLKISNVVGSDELAVRIGKQRDWFEVDGKLTVNEDKVLQLQAVLEQMNARESNFIELGEGDFVAITDELRDRILEMEGLLHRKGKKLQLPTLAASAFENTTEGLEDFEVDLAWTESMERIRKAERIRPRVPKDFRAELRDYQKEGFRWMMRLATWGVGGCLADDMGLGKTVQALAVLAARAKEGPALVIAPASVTRNWLRETERFAPGLIPVLIASRAEADHVKELGAGDVALVSYGLLPFIGDPLQEVHWASIVIDEAQAIKNAATKRAKIVQDLQADFKLATTGTPIENHLGELWSLFRFLNPGLLSSKAAFNEKYNKPIARDGDDDRRIALRKLVQPFILRRRKDEVLTELPPKTEIVLEVTLSEEEKALYEAMRRQAVNEIAQADEKQVRFTVLAQLTKLRQAACHPRLVRPRSKLGSAKLELVGETLQEILANGHKALVFSQFVKHLKIVENWVKGQGIAYQYLDGSTPGKKREESVNAFQGGEGEVFLISLKAGGTGLNLTEADYVLHLDPWWNPAAEDQASDRAHRIGQQRPVTVYRFVSQGTIEEQIIALHAEKRDLADQILAGTGKAASLKVEEILQMITAEQAVN